MAVAVVELGRFYCIFRTPSAWTLSAQLAATFFEPSMANSCWPSRAPRAVPICFSDFPVAEKNVFFLKRVVLLTCMWFHLKYFCFALNVIFDVVIYAQFG